MPGDHTAPRKPWSRDTIGANVRDTMSKERLMNVVNAGDAVITSYDNFTYQIKKLAQDMMGGFLTPSEAGAFILEQLSSPNIIMMQAKQVFEIERIKYRLTAKRNKYAREGMQRLRDKRRGIIGHYGASGQMTDDLTDGGHYGASNQMTDDLTDDLTFTVPQSAQPIDSDHDKVNEALSGVEGGATLQFEPPSQPSAAPPSAAPPSAAPKVHKTQTEIEAERAEALRQALAAETPDEFKPKGLTALEFNGIKLI